VLDCFRQSAHFFLSVAHFFFAVSHCFVVQVSTCAPADGVDDAGAEAAGVGVFGEGDAGVCARATPQPTIPASTTPAATKVRVRFMGIISLLALVMLGALASRTGTGKEPQPVFSKAGLSTGHWDQWGALKTPGGAQISEPRA
jgi:hypothetical protein